jgi:hypothetical protein
VEWALHATAAQLDRLVAAQRRVARSADVRARHDSRYLSWRWDDDGSLIGSFRLPPEQAAVLLQALEVARAELPAAVVPVPDAPAEAHPVDSAGETPAEASPSSIRAEPSVGWQFDPDVVKRFADRYAAEAQPDTPAEASPAPVDDIAAEASPAAPAPRSVEALVQIATQTEDDHGSPLHLGPRTRRIRGRVARAVRYRDGGRCQAPGCTAHATITHHIRHWACGGTTCLINLISLCDGHHWLVHDGGWTIAVTRPGHRTRLRHRQLDRRTPRHPLRHGHPQPGRPSGGKFGSRRSR